MANELRYKTTKGMGTLYAEGWVGNQRISGAALVNPTTINDGQWPTTGIVTLTEEVNGSGTGTGHYVGSPTAIAVAGTAVVQDWYFYAIPPATGDDSIGQQSYLWDGTHLVTAPAAMMALAIDATGRVILQPTGLDPVLIDGKPLPVAIQIIGAMAAGKSSGVAAVGPNTEIYVGLDGVTARAEVTVDATGNRTAVVYH